MKIFSTLLSSILALPQNASLHYATSNKRSVKIVGGLEAKVGDFPYMASLQDGYHFCGGSIISSRYAMSAAHCNVGPHFQVQVGSINNKLGVKHWIDEAIMHPRWNANTIDWDYMVIRIIGFFDFTNAQPVLLIPPGTRDAEVAIFSGWGIHDKDTDGNWGGPTQMLRYTNMKTITREDCIRNYWGGFITDRMICAFSTDHEDGCKETIYWDSADDTYIAGYPSGEYMAFPTLRQAQEVALQMSDVGGITLEPDGDFTLRSGSTYLSSSAGEKSWLVPGDPCPIENLCEPFESWVFAQDRYLAGYAITSLFDTLEEAQQAAISVNNAGGITKETSGKYSVRSGSEFFYSAGEDSWKAPAVSCEPPTPSVWKQLTVKDSICSGDSGGPLVVKINGMNYLMGEASWANGDCENYSPGGFSDNTDPEANAWIRTTANLL